MTARTPAAPRQRTSCGDGIPIGRIAGIEGSLHWTWPIAAIFIALSLADSVFPTTVGGLSRGSYLAMGLLTAVLFFATLLLHELVALVALGRLGGIPDSTATVLEWLGWTNLLLLAVNLLPAFPLDGGRLLRAALWGAMGDELGATRAAVGVSRRLAYTLIAVGLLGALRGIPGGLWLAFVGWFVITAAGAERQAVYDRRGLT